MVKDHCISYHISFLREEVLIDLDLDYNILNSYICISLVIIQET
jgi:hypothetical protein